MFVMNDTIAFVTRGGRTQFPPQYLYVHQVISGSAVVRSHSNAHRLGEDVYLIKNVGSPHVVIAKSSPVYTIGIHEEVVGQERFEECLSPRDYFVDREISSLFLREVTGTDKKGGIDASPLWAALIRARDHSTQDYFLVDRSDQHCQHSRLMNAAREYVLGELSRPLSVSHVAQRVHTSEYHFHRVFSDWHGITPGQYIFQEKVRRACRRLILGADSVAQISRSCGYWSPTSFSKSFQNLTGFTPTEFRKTNRDFKADLAFFTKLSNPAL